MILRADRMNSGKPRTLLALGLLAWSLSIMAGLYLGSVSGADWDLVRELRLPRVILAGAIGMGLAVAGACLQALFTNPLCEPYTLGISSGAALGAVLGATLDLDWNYAGLGQALKSSKNSAEPKP